MNHRIALCRASVLLFGLVLSACQQQTKTESTADEPDLQQEQVLANNTDSFWQRIFKPVRTSSQEDTKPDNLEIATTQAVDVAEIKPREQTIEADGQALLENMGFSEAQDAEVEVVQQRPPFCLGKGHTEPTISVEQACERISNRLASISRDGCEEAKLQHSHCLSVEGFPIMVREFLPLSGREPQGRILVIGGIHGDELTSISIVFKWIEKLNKYHSGLFHWHVVPMMNPDGVLPRSAQRTNKNGVDLNRNLPSKDWQQNALKYWREKQGKNPRRYPGETAGSEPETQWLIDEINEFKPDAIISVHAPYGVVDFDALLLNTAPKSLGKLHLNLLGTYPGSLGNYAGINRNIPVITLELPHAWVMPSEQETTQIWEDIVSWLSKNVNQDLAAETISD